MAVERKEDLRNTWRGPKEAFGLGCGHLKVADVFGMHGTVLLGVNFAFRSLSRHFFS